MCISREHFNLCKCGCPEINHEEPSFFDMEMDNIVVDLGFSPSGRGRCLGEIPIDLIGEEIRKLIDEAKANGTERPKFTKPCECMKFEPFFKPMCTGFGG